MRGLFVDAREGIVYYSPGVFLAGRLRGVIPAVFHVFDVDDAAPVDGPLARLALVLNLPRHLPFPVERVELRGDVAEVRRGVVEHISVDVVAHLEPRGARVPHPCFGDQNVDRVAVYFEVAELVSPGKVRDLVVVVGVDHKLPARCDQKLRPGRSSENELLAQ